MAKAWAARPRPGARAARSCARWRRASADDAPDAEGAAGLDAALLRAALQQMGLDDDAQRNLVALVRAAARGDRRRARRPDAGGGTLRGRDGRLARHAAFALRPPRARAVGHGGGRPRHAPARLRPAGHRPPTTASSCASPMTETRLPGAELFAFDPDELGPHRARPRGRHVAVRGAVPRVRRARPADVAHHAGKARPAVAAAPQGRPAAGGRAARAASSPSFWKRRASACRTCTTCRRSTSSWKGCRRAACGWWRRRRPSRRRSPRRCCSATWASTCTTGDLPHAERRASLLSLDPALLGELLGSADMAELLDADVVCHGSGAAAACRARPSGARRRGGGRPAARPGAAVRERGRRAHAGRRGGGGRRRSGRGGAGCRRRRPRPVGAGLQACRRRKRLLAALREAHRAFPTHIGGDERWAAADDAALLHEALGVEVPAWVRLRRGRRGSRPSGLKRPGGFRSGSASRTRRLARAGRPTVSAARRHPPRCPGGALCAYAGTLLHQRGCGAFGRRARHHARKPRTACRRGAGHAGPVRQRDPGRRRSGRTRARVGGCRGVSAGSGRARLPRRAPPCRRCLRRAFVAPGVGPAGRGCRRGRGRARGHGWGRAGHRPVRRRVPAGCGLGGPRVPQPACATTGRQCWTSWWHRATWCGREAATTPTSRRGAGSGRPSGRAAAQGRPRVRPRRVLPDGFPAGAGAASRRRSGRKPLRPSPQRAALAMPRTSEAGQAVGRPGRGRGACGWRAVLPPDCRCGAPPACARARRRGVASPPPCGSWCGSGRATNDTFAPGARRRCRRLRARRLRARAAAPPRQQPARAATGAAMRLRRTAEPMAAEQRLRRGQRALRARLLSGRWSLLAPSPENDTVRAVALVESILDRYGVLVARRCPARRGVRRPGHPHAGAAVVGGRWATCCGACSWKAWGRRSSRPARRWTCCAPMRPRTMRAEPRFGDEARMRGAGGRRSRRACSGPACHGRPSRAATHPPRRAPRAGREASWSCATACRYSTRRRACAPCWPSPRTRRRSKRPPAPWRRPRGRVRVRRDGAEGSRKKVVVESFNGAARAGHAVRRRPPAGRASSACPTACASTWTPSPAEPAACTKNALPGCLQGVSKAAGRPNGQSVLPTRPLVPRQLAAQAVRLRRLPAPDARRGSSGSDSKLPSNQYQLPGFSSVAFPCQDVRGDAVEEPCGRG